MRVLFIDEEEIEAVMERLDCDRWGAIETIAPWACRIAECDGGVTVFESSDEYETWKNQK